MQAVKNLVIGILAHVDAGKTTLSEALLYLSGKLKKLGRVDHRDSFLDTDRLERARGITIFSKQALLRAGGTELTLMDTPGHVDFSAETERTLAVLDYAVLVISASDGVQAHTETLWRLLRRRQIPCFLFVTKMDLPGTDEAALMEELQRRLSESCVDFSRRGPDFEESVAMCSEELLDRYLKEGKLTDGDLAALIARRELFPCYFGSGLKLDGVEAMLDGLDRYTLQPLPAAELAGKIYKISRDPQGNRLSWLKLSGGELKVRSLLRYRDENGAEREEKITQLRRYSGMKFEAVESVSAGQTAAALGLSETYAGQGLGTEADAGEPALEPFMSYTVLPEPGLDPALLLPKLQQLQEEDPQLGLSWNEQSREISVQLMGKVQAEVFKSLVRERFDLDVELDRGHILYRETIAGTVEGVGHFEPLRHYAEVHLLLEPLPPGGGIVLDSVCSEDALDRNWQRLILSQLQEKRHLGVLTGAPLTDVKISLAAGRAHPKHTEGGDFRQAAFRAVRQGLMQAESVLLEPWGRFSLTVPPEQIGRAISDIRAMNGVFGSPEEAGEFTRLEGSAPAECLGDYGAQVAAYTHGRGRFSFRPDGYRPCRRQEEIVRESGYEPLRDLENPADSVFCAHGAGFVVRWDRVPDYMHLDSCLKKQREAAPPPAHRSLSIDERELEALMEREFGPIRRPVYRPALRNEAPPPAAQGPARPETLIVDGYNLIFAWKSLRELGRDRLELARQRLMDMLSSYCGYTRAELVLVFDGFRTPGNPGSRSEYHNIHVAYTRDGETADAYIERLVDEIGKNYTVRVVTSDNLIRLSALRSGVLRCSSGEFEAEVETVLDRIDEIVQKTNAGAHKARLGELQKIEVQTKDDGK